MSGGGGGHNVNDVDDDNIINTSHAAISHQVSAISYRAGRLAFRHLTDAIPHATYGIQNMKYANNHVRVFKMREDNPKKTSE